jgi:glucose uptake protein GlcU
MCFFLSLIPATFWGILAYLVLFVSTKAEGVVKTIGQGLAIWVFIIVIFILIGGAYVTFSDLCPIEKMMAAMHAGAP